MTTLLERAKGSALDIVIERNSSNTITLLLPHVQRIKHLTFPLNYQSQIFTDSQVISGPLPLLRTLKISANYSDDPQSRPNTFAALPPLLFRGAVNLEEFDFELDSAGSLKSFVFPNLITFKLLTAPLVNFNASDLLDFLKASPMLQTVEVRIDWDMVLEDIPRELVVLPNVKTFSLSVSGAEQQVYEPAVHISCPHATYTSLEQHIFDNHMTFDVEAFPRPGSCKTIVYHYSAGPVDEVTLEIGGCQFPLVATYSLTFKSSDAAVVRFGFELGASLEDLHMSHGEMDLEIFSQACWTIRNHPLLSHVNRLHIKDGSGSFGTDYGMRMADVLWDLLESLGPLDQLTFDGFGLQRLLPESSHVERVFPPVRELTISEECMFDDERRGVDAIVELAVSQHNLEKPFERIRIYARDCPMFIEVWLRQWVGAVDFYELRS